MGIYNHVRRKHNPNTIVNLDVVITECCTLRCQDCSNLMQYYHHPENLDSEEIIMALKILMKSFKVSCLNLLGGEPFVCQEKLIRILEYLAKETRGCFDEIVIITNGTVVPSAKCLDIMSDIQELTVLFSNYGELSSKMDTAIALCRSRGIKYEIIEEKYWWDCGDLTLRDDKERIIQRRYDGCYTRRHCTTLYRGKLYVCPRQAHSIRLGVIPEDSSEIVDLINIEQNLPESLRDAVYRIYDRKKYISTCKHCGCDSETKIPRAIQIERPLDVSSYT